MDRILSTYSYGICLFSMEVVDYVHLIVVLPPKLSISNFKGYLKGKSTLMIYDKCR